MPSCQGEQIAGTPLLETKLHPPRRRGLVPRPRLRAQLHRPDQPALTLVSAPAGFGKTTLVAEWFADGRATAWLSLDSGDNDPIRFWTYVIAALRTVAPDACASAQAFLEAPQPSLDAAVATLLNDLNNVDHELVLVLDDYHVIESVEIHDTVTFLVEHLPPHVRLVIASRADPPVPLASLRARGELAETRAADLRFTTDEAAAYLNSVMGLSLTPADIAVLEGRTEGWIAALQLAALSLEGRDDTAAFVAEFAGDDRFILDYLVDEVLDRQTGETRDFLLDTSILNRLTGSLCDAVTGRSDGKAALVRLERANLFLVPLDDRRTWYRYHHLFADVLRARLLDDHPDLVPELHRRAIDWYDANGDRAEAIAHAMAGGHAEQAARLIELEAPHLRRTRQESTVRRWLEALPPDVYVNRPVLTANLIGSRMATGERGEVERLLEVAEAALQPSAPPPVVYDLDDFAHLPAQLAVFRAGLALLTGDIDGTIRHATRVLDLTEASDHYRRGAAQALLGLAHWATGDLVHAERRYTEAVGSFVSADYLPDMLGCSLALADIQIGLGRLRDAAQTFQAALHVVDEHPGLRGAADMHVGLSEVLIDRNDLDGAERHLQVSTDLGPQAGLPQHAYRWRVATARLRQARGDLDGALALLDEAAPLYDTDFSPPVRPVSALRARVQLARGDVDAAVQWARARRLDAHDDLTYVREYEHVTLARALLAQQDPGAVRDAIALLTRLLAAAEAGGRAGSAIEILTLLAAAHHRIGDSAAAAAAVEDAVRRAEPEGYVRVFLDAPAAVLQLVRSMAANAGAPGHARHIVGSAELAPAPALATAPARSAPLVEGLSARELDVLRLLRTDLSGPDIARELLVSLNTFRTHTKNIYAKLGANNRREAVRRARELGL